MSAPGPVGRRKPRLQALVAAAFVVMMVLSAPLSASAAETTYRSGSFSRAVWQASGYVTSHRHNAISEFHGATVQARAGSSWVSTGTGGVYQTYAKKRQPLYCRWTQPDISTIPRVPLRCSYEP